MTPERLYIIGNGFDLHHGLKSRYWDFKSYLENKDKDLLEKLEEYFSSDSLWSDFEGTLEYLDTENIVEECLDYLMDYSDDNWSDSGHHDYQFEVQNRIDLLTKRLKARFTEWIIQLELTSNADNCKVSLDKNAYFINFNYKDTLERLYQIPLNNIWYIHNKAIDENSTLILGHSRNPKSYPTLSQYNDEDTDVRIAEGNHILDSYFESTYKSTERIIKENIVILDQFKNLKSIYVLGHSLSPVDLPYFKEIIKRIDTKSVQWKVSFYNKKELEHHKAVMNSLFIDPNLIEYDRINKFDSSQLSLFPKKKI